VRQPLKGFFIVPACRSPTGPLFKAEGGLVSLCSGDSAAAAPALRGDRGELVLVRVAVDWRALEDLLDALARASFPVNPEIQHGNPSTIVEFPAYESELEEVSRLLSAAGLGACPIETANILTTLR
jgi:hypothetical protein